MRNYEFLATGPRPPAADVAHKIPPPRASMVVAVTEAVISVGAVAAVVAFMFVGMPIMCVLPGLLAVAMGEFSVMMFRFALTPAVITASALTTPGMVHGWTVVPLRDIAGVGLRYRSTGNGRSSGWALFVWRELGEPVGIKVAPPNHSAPPGQRRAVHSLTGYVPPLDWGYLAGTKAGGAAASIDAAVTTAQQAGGLLTTTRREHDPATYGSHTAFWSPTGTIDALIETHQKRGTR